MILTTQGYAPLLLLFVKFQPHHMQLLNNEELIFKSLTLHTDKILIFHKIRVIIKTISVCLIFKISRQPDC